MIGQLFQYNKALVALIMALLMIAEDWFGISFPGVNEQWVITTLALITPLIVMVTPNMK